MMNNSTESREGGLSLEAHLAQLESRINLKFTFELQEMHYLMQKQVKEC